MSVNCFVWLSIPLYVWALLCICFAVLCMPCILIKQGILPWFIIQPTKGSVTPTNLTDFSWPLFRLIQVVPGTRSSTITAPPGNKTPVLRAGVSTDNRTVRPSTAPPNAPIPVWLRAIVAPCVTKVTGWLIFLIFWFIAFKWLIDWLIEWVVYWLSEWMSGWLNDWLIDWMREWLIGWKMN